MMKCPVDVVGVGYGGVAELQRFLDDRCVLWALLRFDTGSGTFRRHKVILVHFNGELCPPIARGRLNGHLADVQGFLRGHGGAGASRGFHATLEVKRQRDASVEGLLERLAGFFVSDDIANVSIQDLRKDYERQIAETQAAAAARRKADGGGLRRRRSSGAAKAKVLRRPSGPAPAGGAAALRRGSSKGGTGPLDGKTALLAVGERMGKWNWVLVFPDADALPLVGCGLGSVDEMRSCVEAHGDAVMFGMLRMSFGQGRLRRTKFIFVQASGANVSIIKRGKLSSNRPKMQAALARYANFMLTFEVNHPNDLQQEDVIYRVRRAAVIDDDVLVNLDLRAGQGQGPTPPAKGAYTVDAFREALAEEQAAAAATLGEEEQDDADEAGSAEDGVSDVDEGTPGSELTAEEAVWLVHAADEPHNWALFKPSEDMVQRASSRKFAPPMRLGVPADSGARSKSSPPVGRRSTANGKPMFGIRSTSRPPIGLASSIISITEEEPLPPADFNVRMDPDSTMTAAHELAAALAAGTAIADAALVDAAAAEASAKDASLFETRRSNGTASTAAETAAALPPTPPPRVDEAPFEAPAGAEALDARGVGGEPPAATEAASGGAQAAWSRGRSWEELGVVAAASAPAAAEKVAGPPKEDLAPKGRGEGDGEESDLEDLMGGLLRTVSCPPEMMASMSEVDRLAATFAAERNICFELGTHEAPLSHQPRFCGPLLKESASWLRGWQLRWFEVGGGYLSWWDSPEAGAAGLPPIGQLLLSGATARVDTDKKTRIVIEGTNAKNKSKVYVLDGDAQAKAKQAKWTQRAVQGWDKTRLPHLAAQDWVDALTREATIEQRLMPQNWG